MNTIEDKLPEGTDGWAIEHAPWCDDFFPDRTYTCPCCGNLLVVHNCVLRCDGCRVVVAMCQDL